MASFREFGMRREILFSLDCSCHSESWVNTVLHLSPENMNLQMLHVIATNTSSVYDAQNILSISITLIYLEHFGSLIYFKDLQVRSLYSRYKSLLVFITYWQPEHFVQGNMETVQRRCHLTVKLYSTYLKEECEHVLHVFENQRSGCSWNVDPCMYVRPLDFTKGFTFWIIGFSTW